MTKLEEKLKNPVWSSLCETHKHFSIDYENVKFYHPEICPFGAFTDSSKTLSAINKYSKLTNNFFLVSENKTPIFDKSKVALENKIEGCQMVLQELPDIEISEEIILLTDKYIDEIYELIWLVMPGYYRKRTFEMGDYYGILRNNKLVSITGMRMQNSNFIELSAVVTHPDYTRQGLAKQLSHFVTKKIQEKEKHPILHTNKGNPAIKMYEKLGYTITRDMNWWYFVKK